MPKCDWHGCTESATVICTVGSTKPDILLCQVHDKDMEAHAYMLGVSLKWTPLREATDT